MVDRSDQPAIILVDPQMGENIGMVARAMLNCGLTDLRIVRPRDGWPSQPAIDNSAGAVEVIDTARLYDTTKDATADLQFVLATTGRAREMVTKVFTPDFAAQEMHQRINDGVRTGVLFGGERSGLVNEDVALADAVISVPLNPDFKSLNLAQAVLLVAHHWFLLGDQTPKQVLEMNDSSPATLAELGFFIDALENELVDGGFFKSPNMKPVVMRNLRNLFQRAELTQQEIRTLHGITKAIRYAGERSVKGQKP